MAEITVPDQELLIGRQWFEPVPNVAVNRSEFSSASTSWQGPGPGFWSLRCQLRTRVKESQKIPWRLFWQRVSNRANYFRVIRRCNQIQGIDINPAFYSTSPVSGLTDFQCKIFGMAGSVRNLKAGQYVTIIFSATRAQLLMLDADLVADGTGAGVATFTQPVGGTIPGAGLTVHLHNPFAFFRLDNPQAGLDESSGQLNMAIEASEYV